MNIIKIIVALFFVFLSSINCTNAINNILGPKNILIYKRQGNDSICLVQLIQKKDSILILKCCEFTGAINIVEKLEFEKLDSLIENKFHLNFVEQISETYWSDTIIQINDPIFFSNNSLYSLPNEVYYVKFNVSRINRAYSADDVDELFITGISLKKDKIKFWNSSDHCISGYPIYIFQRGFWFLSFSKNDILNGAYILNSFNGVNIKLKEDDLLELY